MPLREELNLELTNSLVAVLVKADPCLASATHFLSYRDYCPFLSTQFGWVLTYASCITPC